MKSNPITRMTFGGALVAAFVGGLVFASGLDLTRFGYAQSSTRPASSVAPIVPPSVTDLNVAFSSIAERVTPAVVSIHSERTQRQRNAAATAAARSASRAPSKISSGSSTVSRRSRVTPVAPVSS